MGENASVGIAFEVPTYTQLIQQLDEIWKHARGEGGVAGNPYNPAQPTPGAAAQDQWANRSPYPGSAVAPTPYYSAGPPPGSVSNLPGAGGQWGSLRIDRVDRVEILAATTVTINTTSV